jgi:hypothetical protein
LSITLVKNAIFGGFLFSKRKEKKILELGNSRHHKRRQKKEKERWICFLKVKNPLRNTKKIDKDLKKRERKYAFNLCKTWSMMAFTTWVSQSAP